jgi:YidC/Oxa1 family membrane protein insertase
VNFYAFPPIAAVLEAAYGVVAGLADLLTPVAGDAAAALAVIVLTLLVRTVLIPVGASQVRAELTRRRLSPQLRELQRRHKGTPEVLQRKTMELYRREHASPLAGMLPALAQAPVLSTMYGLFILTSINGHANALLAAHLFTVPLATSFVQFVEAGAAAGALMPGLAVFLVLLLVMAGIAYLSRRTALTQAGVAALPGTAGRPASADAATAIQRRVTAALSWAPFITVAFAGFVPLAAALYLAVTTAWTLVERALLRKRFGGLPAFAPGER